MKFQKIVDFLYCYYFCLWIGCYLLGMFTGFAGPAVIMGSVNLLIIFNSVFYNRSGKMNLFRNQSFLYIYVAWLIISIVFSVVLNGVSLAIPTAVYVLTPMGLLFYPTTRDKLQVFWNSFLAGLVFNNLFGIVCFYSKAPFFIRYFEKFNAASLSQITHHAGVGRLVTLTGSIETGVLSAMGVVISLWFLIRKSKFKECYVFSLAVSMVTIILTQQRGPLFAVIGCILFIILYSYRERLLKFKYILIIVLAFIGAMVFLYLYKHTVFVWMIERITNPSDAIEERYDYQFAVLKESNVFEWVVGKSLGSLGFFVENSNRGTRIFDQMYFNMIGETGIIGIVLFALTCICTLRPFFSNVKGLFGPFFVVVIILIDGLGTTIFYCMPIMPFFWVSIKILLDVNIDENMYLEKQQFDNILEKNN